MKLLLTFLSAILFLISCRKGEILKDRSAKLRFSTDTLFFDTIFTSVGSTTRRIKIYNPNKQAVKISEIKLEGGSSSPYQLNVNGRATHHILDYELGAQDSMYLFVKVTIDPTSQQLPFVVSDSLSFLTNGNLQRIQLRAYGQNARFLRDASLNSDEIWDNQLPFVIYGTLRIRENTTLTIEKGTKVFLHKGAKISVEGKLDVRGTLSDSVVFASDRPENIYLEEAGQWDGIHFLPSSKDNRINYAVIKNGITALELDSPSLNDQPKLLLTNTKIRNMAMAGILAHNSSVTGFNNLISNCGQHLIYASSGGNYTFIQNTFANYNYYFSRSTPSVEFTDRQGAAKTVMLNLTLSNNIIWGSLTDELNIEQKSVGNSVVIQNNLIRSRDKTLEPANILNADPLFLHPRNRNFRLSTTSPAANKGKNLQQESWLQLDLSGKPRIFPSDLGSYEIQ
ncbi:right-handed parallel beta-helix repeat-containing protein [Pedobacter sp. SYSU D00535]|uniref:right-handed parallel beta-helix repeat-containing protein n=1 Tax=Pedobacter sp. SYSU D00535 TaxID=2810308 RepID=UPI001A97B0F9|nr:right-handed parallel beta-helix repeat-containing protein [Pedobacter sp. SYSU D00535]